MNLLWRKVEAGVVVNEIPVVGGAVGILRDAHILDCVRAIRTVKILRQSFNRGVHDARDRVVDPFAKGRLLSGRQRRQARSRHREAILGRSRGQRTHERQHETQFFSWKRDAVRHLLLKARLIRLHRGRQSIERGDIGVQIRRRLEWRGLKRGGQRAQA